MKNLLILGIIVITVAALSFEFFSRPFQSQASGTLTNNSSNPGTVKVVRNGQTMYLTTTVDGTQTATTTPPAPATSSRRIGGSLGEVLLPRGFASNAGSLISSILTIVMAVAGLLVLLYLILAGFQWITSGGDKGKTEAARNKIVSAVIGIIIIAASYAILAIVLRFLGFGGINDVFQAVRPINVEGTPTPTPQAETDLGQVILATPSATPTTP